MKKVVLVIILGILSSILIYGAYLIFFPSRDISSPVPDDGIRVIYVTPEAEN